MTSNADGEGDESKSLSTRFNEAETCRKSLENGGLSSSSQQYHDTLTAGLQGYEDCVKMADRVSLFSPNESLEDISSGDLQYLLIHFHLGELRGRVNDARKTSLEQSRRSYLSFLQLLDSYDVLSPDDSKTYARYLDDPSTFSTASTTDATARRNTKISRFREERALQTKLEHLHRNPSNDDSTLRETHLTHIALRTHQTFANLESIAQELAILSLAPPSPSPTSNTSQQHSSDTRRRQANGDTSNDGDGYSDRLDTAPASLRARNGPILAADGRPLRPFTLLDTRARLRDGVFRPDHNLPTMTIDEYLEEERKRGGIIEKGSGGEASGVKTEVDEDDADAVDRRTMEQRRWDEFKEANPKGSGNTMNMG